MSEKLTRKVPFTTVDTIIEVDGGIVLIKRKNPPFGWAIPGGFVDYGETLEEAAIREAREETGLDITLVRQFHTYSEPSRDPRHHTISTVYIAIAKGVPIASDDAKEARIFKDMDSLPEEIAFDHRKILEDFFRNRY
jgi:ADP-ribose pyrophosphatase YjhB (NUDIX family)